MSAPRHSCSRTHGRVCTRTFGQALLQFAGNFSRCTHGSAQFIHLWPLRRKPRTSTAPALFTDCRVWCSTLP